MTTDAVRAFVAAWEALHELPLPGTPEARAWSNNERREAAHVVASARLGYVTVQLTEHFDWDRLRVNVYHHVEPRLVKWRAG